MIGIASGMLFPKKEKQKESSLYLNYGLLGLLTNLKDKALILCKSLSDEMMTEQDYIDLKSICYSPTMERKKEYGS